MREVNGEIFTRMFQIPNHDGVYQSSRVCYLVFNSVQRRRTDLKCMMRDLGEVYQERVTMRASIDLALQD